jgi:hypothetical protein
MFVVGPNFKGVKMLLPGPHFVYYSSRSRIHGGDVSPVTGFFVNASPSQVWFVSISYVCRQEWCGFLLYTRSKGDYQYVH